MRVPVSVFPPRAPAVAGVSLALNLFLGLAVAAGPAGAASPGMASIGELQPHRAVYDMELAQTADSSFSQGFGRIVIEMSDACDGFIVSQRQRIELITRDGTSFPSDVNGSTWEAKDGGLYRFSVERLEGMNGPARQVGRATLADGGTGIAAYRMPEDMEEVELPKGTMFPTTHLAATLDAAKAGKPVFSAPLFDGYEPKVYEVSAAISPARAEPADADYPFADQKAWSVRFAFYDHGSAEAVPSYEIDLHLYANGVASEGRFDYGDFRLEGRLSNYEPLPRAQCD